MTALAMIELVLLVGLLFAAAHGAVFSALVAMALRHTEHWAPNRRFAFLLLFSFTPLALTVALLAAVLLPGALSFAWPAFDHCLEHGDHHLHLCVAHLPVHGGNALSTFVLAAAACWLFFRALRASKELLRASRLISQLRQSSRVDTALGADVLPIADPLCFSAGILTSRILVSQGFISGTTTEQLAVALLHERAHASRHDILWRLVARVATVFFWPHQRATLLRALELSAERSCDETAAKAAGDRLQIAEAILKVERLLTSVPTLTAPVVAALGGMAVPERVTALLAPPLSAGNFRVWFFGLGVALVVIVSANEPIHHFTESVVALIAH